MLLLKLWNYMRGYVIINVEGLALEKFINLCIAKNIYLWDIKRTNYTTLEAKISARGFKGLRRIVKKAGCKVHIRQKNGYPFWIYKLKKRKMLLVGAFFCILLLIFASTFIFSIEIVGNENITKSEILFNLNSLGLKSGTNRYFINLRELEHQLLLNVDNLAWVGIELKGINAKVEIVEKIVPPSKIDKNTPCNVVAKKNGVIEKIIARNGEAIVKQGDIVKEGDILISGTIQLEHVETTTLVHSYGEVYAKTYYEVNESKNLFEIKKEMTGEKLAKKILKLGNIELSLNKNKIPYESYIIETNYKKPLQWRKIGLPIELITEEYFQVNEVKITINEVAAKNEIHTKAITSILEEIPFEAKILNTQVDFTIQEGVLYGKVIVEALEDIALQKKLQTGED